MGPISDGTSCRVCKLAFEGDRVPIKRRVQWAICKPCYNSYMRTWKANNPAYIAGLCSRSKIVVPIYKEKYKRLVFNAYGNVCACCGETIEEFLTIEHKNGGGGAHRKKRNFLGILIDIIRAGFPPEYCLLCMNCNWVKRKGRICPHELARRQQAVAAD